MAQLPPPSSSSRLLLSSSPLFLFHNHGRIRGYVTQPSLPLHALLPSAVWSNHWKTLGVVRTGRVYITVP